MNIVFLLVIYAVAIVAWSVFARRRQAKKQDERFKGLEKGAEVETIGGLIALVDEVDVENNRIVLDAEGVFLTFDLQRSIMKVLTPAPGSTASDTIINEEAADEITDSAIESQDKD